MWAFYSPQGTGNMRVSFTKILIDDIILSLNKIIEYMKIKQHMYDLRVYHDDLANIVNEKIFIQSIGHINCSP